MDLAQFQRGEIWRWLIEVLDQSDLGAGRIRSAFDTRRGSASNRAGWQSLGTAQSPLLTITATDAVEFDTVREMLATQPGAAMVATQVDELILADTERGDEVLAGSFEGAFRGLRAAATAVLLPEAAWYKVPAWAWALPAPPVFTTPALKADEVVFIHPCGKATYLVQPVADVFVRGFEADVYVGAEIAKPPNQPRLPISFCRIV